MAQIKNKLYGYPVLTNYTDDFVGVEFEAGTTGELEIYNSFSKIHFQVLNSDSNLNTLIKENKAKIITNLYCKETKYRKIFELNRGISEIIVDNKEINKNVSINTYIVATENINDYYSENFNNDYSKMKFSISKGNILAFGKEENFFIEKDINEFTKMNSVISIAKNPDNSEEMKVDYSNDKIKILISDKDFNIYSEVSKFETPILLSMIVVPALMYVLDEISKDDTDIYDIQDKRWYRIICKKTLAITGREFSPELIKNHGSLELIQKLFEFPISTGLNKIKENVDKR